MIGYYVHHVGRGHLSRATAIAAELREPVTALSSLDRPLDWDGEWVTLPRDDASPTAGERDATANGRLHWVPLHEAGLRDRMAQVSAWIARARPSVLVADVSVEIALLARLHGVPVVSVALPGRRDDEAHRLGFAASTAIISAWPPEAEGMLSGLDESSAAKHVPVGAISRYPGETALDAHSTETGGDRQPRVLVLNGRGGGLDPATVRRARQQTPDWHWDVVGGVDAPWVENPWPRIRRADVVVTHAGQNALAELAAARKPAVVIPESRPHDEQRHTAAVLAAGAWPVVVLDRADHDDWARVLATAVAYDGTAWRTWNPGTGAARAAAVIESVAEQARRAAGGAA